ncbi:MAG: radical SAM protein [Paludibacteraceae bacterium]|nr:radical SAM protein [Paludibacteraceae bacterium]
MMIPCFWSIEPTNACSLHCPQCPSGSQLLTRKRGYMDVENYKKILEKIAPHALYLNLYFQGEPTLHPQLPTLIQLAKGHGLYVALSTNGQHINAQTARRLVRSGLDKMIVSVDGMNQRSYETYRRGGSLDKALKSIHYVTDYKRTIGSYTPRVEMQTLAFRHNEDELPALKRLAKDLGARFKVKTAQFYTCAPDDTLQPPDSARLSRYVRGEDGTLRLRRRLPNRCFHLLTSAVVTWEGDVLPCVFDKDARYVFGNILKEDVSSIFKSARAKEFRRRVFTKRKAIDICNNCCY